MTPPAAVEPKRKIAIVGAGLVSISMSVILLVYIRGILWVSHH